MHFPDSSTHASFPHLRCPGRPGRLGPTLMCPPFLHLIGVRPVRSLSAHALPSQQYTRSLPAFEVPRPPGGLGPTLICPPFLHSIGVRLVRSLLAHALSRHQTVLLPGYHAHISTSIRLVLKDIHVLASWHLAGVGLITWSDAHSSQESSGVTGDLLVLLSAACYAAYTTTIRLRLPDDEHVSMALFFGLIGALNLLCLAPVVILLGLLKPITFAGLGTRVFFLTVFKGDTLPPPLPSNPSPDTYTPQAL